MVKLFPALGIKRSEFHLLLLMRQTNALPVLGERYQGCPRSTSFSQQRLHRWLCATLPFLFFFSFAPVNLMASDKVTSLSLIIIIISTAPLQGSFDLNVAFLVSSSWCGQRESEERGAKTPGSCLEVRYSQRPPGYSHSPYPRDRMDSGAIGDRVESTPAS